MQLSRTDLKIYSSLKRKSKREEHGLFIAEGVKVCQELINSDFSIKGLFCNHENADIFKEATIISEKDAQRISNQKNNSGVFAVVELPKEKQKPVDINKDIIVLENINDPGNLGAIIRTMDWFGFSQIICSENSVDAFNPKTIMASMGSVFRVQPHYLDTTNFLKNKKVSSYATLMNGQSVNTTKFNNPSVIVFGNESHGISNELMNHIQHSISIPGKGKAESLNLSNSSAIIINELYRQRNQG